MIEIMRFHLAEGVDRTEFLASDRRVQTEFAYHQPGLQRRTTASADDGEWIVVDLWRSAADADRCALAWEEDPVTTVFMTFVDPASVSVARYESLD